MADKRGKSKKNSHKRPRDTDKPVKGKGSIRNLFSNAVPKKTQMTSLAEDNILADILGELHDKPFNSSTSKTAQEIPVTELAPIKHIAPARILSKSSRKSDATLANDYMNNFINNIKMAEKVKGADKTSDDELLDSILKPKATVPNKKVLEKSKEITEKADTAKQMKGQVPVKETDTVPVEKALTNMSVQKPNVSSIDTPLGGNDFPDDDIDFSNLQDNNAQFEKVTEDANDGSKISPKKNMQLKAAPVKDADHLQNLLSNWEQICQMDNFEEETTNGENDFTSNTMGKEDTVKFWYWEAWEDPNKCPGEVFMFGRTSENKSICVRVGKIDRVLYLLPRKYVNDENIKYLTL